MSNIGFSNVLVSDQFLLNSLIEVSIKTVYLRILCSWHVCSWYLHILVMFATPIARLQFYYKTLIYFRLYYLHKSLLLYKNIKLLNMIYSKNKPFRDTSHYQVTYTMLKLKSWISVKIFYIQLKRTTESLKYVSSCYTVSEKHQHIII